MGNKEDIIPPLCPEVCSVWEENRAPPLEGVSLGHKKEGNGHMRLSEWGGEPWLTVDRGYWSLEGTEDEAQIWQPVWNNTGIKAGWLLWQLR